MGYSPYRPGPEFNIMGHLDIHPRVAAALSEGRPVVALESTIISHGMPWPQNLETARSVEAVVEAEGAVPATIGVCGGIIRIGLDAAQIEHFARSKDVAKVSRRDLATVVAEGGDGATTVAGTILCAARAGIRVLATGGIGGVHRGAQTTWDISADLIELARTDIAVVCSGAKAILDLPKTLEALETRGVSVLGYGTDCFPAFYSRDSRLPVDARVDSPEEAARILRVRRDLGLGGIVIANPIPQADAIERAEVEAWIRQALAEAKSEKVTGKQVTPFLLDRVAQLSGGRALEANIALVKNNAAVAARIAAAALVA